MQILTDILSLFKRKQIIKEATPEDLLVLGRHEEPDMLGIASPIPYKSVKLIRVKDLLETKECSYANIVNGAGTSPARIYSSTTPSPCTVNLRTLTAVGNNLRVEENVNEIEISTSGEPNVGINLGKGAEVYKDKVGEALRFRTLVGNKGINVSELGDDYINITLSRLLINSPNGGLWEITVDNEGTLITTQVG